MPTHVRIALTAALVAAIAPFAAARQDAHDHAPARVAVNAVEPPDTPAGRRLAWIMDMLNSVAPIDVAGRFAPEFAANISEDRVRATITNLAGGSHGFVLKRIDETSPNALIAVAVANVDASTWRIAVATEPDEPHRVSTLFFQPAPQEMIDPFTDWASVDAAVAQIGAPDASLAVFRVAEDGSCAPLHAINADEPLAIGSTFKLWALGALAEAVASGDAAWDEGLAVREEWKSLPSGVMQDIRAGDRAPIAEFARNMIAISDNTATDHIIHRLGRERVHAYMAKQTAHADRNTPFLTTREFFTIKLADDGTLLHRYADADAAQRATMLEGEIAADEPVIELADLWLVPQRIRDVEWFATTAETARTLAALYVASRADGMEPLRDALTANPGVPYDRAAFTRVWFKGGSEPGVINLTWLLERADGAVFALSMTVNDPQRALHEARTIGVAQRIVEFLATAP